MSSSTDGAAFRYQALHKDGSVESGIIYASGKDLVISQLKARSLLPVKIQRTAALKSHKARIPVNDLTIGLRILSDLLNANLPISKALSSFNELAPKSWQPGLEPLQNSIREGKSFVSALNSSGLEIPTLVLGMIQAGEAGGNLGQAIRRAADVSETTAATRSALRSALAYPIVLAIAGFGAVGLLMGVVLPKFATILADMGQSLPANTRMVILIADVMRASAIPAFVSVIVALIIWKLWVATANSRRLWHEFLLSIPFVGQIRHRTSTSYVASSLASLLDSGVPLPAALVHAGRAGGDSAIEARMHKAREEVLTGKKLGLALEHSQVLTSTGIRLVRAGEDTGRVIELLYHIAKIESAQAQQVVKSVIKMIEPVMILVFGAIVAFVAAALLQAIYSMGPGGL